MTDLSILIKQNVTMPDIISFYGIEMKKGMIKCPFHNEKTGSMKIYKDHFYCFGCGENGDVISFVMKYEDIDFKEACKAIDGYFSLGIYNSEISEEKKEFIKRKKAERCIKDSIEKRLEKEKSKALRNYAACDVYIDNHSPKEQTDSLSKTFVRALHYKEYWWSVYEVACYELQLLRKEG